MRAGLPWRKDKAGGRSLRARTLRVLAHPVLDDVRDNLPTWLDNAHVAVPGHDADRGVIAAGYALSDALGNEAIVLGAHDENGAFDAAPLDRNTEDRHLAAGPS